MAGNTDILFVYTNINGFHSDTYSFGVGYLSSVLKENGFKTALVVVKTKRDYSNVLKAISEYKPKVVGFTAVSSQFVFISDLSRMIKSMHDCIAVCGGVHPTIFPDCIKYAPYLDGIFRGECESSFLDFTSLVVSGKDHKDVDNFCYLDNGRLVMNKLRPRILNIETLPFPDRDMYDYQSIIDANGGTATIMASRGCPFSCTYCCNHAIARVYGEERNVIRHNSVEKSLAEIDILRSKYRFDKLWYIDDLFVFNRQWLDRFLFEYKKKFSIPFMCQIRPNACSRDMLFNLKDAGCFRIFVAIESANDYIRNTVMKRNITKQQIEDTFVWAKEAGLETLSSNIIGVPGETEETVMEAVDFNRRMNPTAVGINIFSPYEGTVLGDYCHKSGFVRNVDARLFSDRKQSMLSLPTIKNDTLMRLFDSFNYLVYKEIDPVRARQILINRYFKKLENVFLLGALFRILRKVRKVKITCEKILLRAR